MSVTNYRFVYASICVAVFISGLSMGHSASSNMLKILYFELFIIALCLISLQPQKKSLKLLADHMLPTVLSGVLILVLLVYYYPTLERTIYLLLILFTILTRDLTPYTERLKRNRWLTVLVIGWLVSITFSFYASPLDVSSNYLSRVRFEQTFIHIVCFFCLMVFLQENQFQGKYLLLSIPASILIVGICSAYIYLEIEPRIGHYQWFRHPPFNSHMRHVGFQISAGLGVLLAYLMGCNVHGRLKNVMYTLGALLLWAFLFWSGGRAAIGSVLVFLVLAYVGMRKKNYLIGCMAVLSCSSLVIGLILSEWWSVYSWNGLFSSIGRTITNIQPAEVTISNLTETVNAVTTGRLMLWSSAFEGLKGEWLFGLGTNAYSYIESVRGLTPQPHNFVIQFLVEWGVIGAVLFMVLLTWVFISGYKQLVSEDISWAFISKLAAGGVIITLAIQSLMDGALFHAQPVFNLVVAFSILLSGSQRSEGRYLSDKFRGDV